MAKVPVLQLKDILLTSIQVDLTDQDALDFQSGVLRRIVETEAKGIVIDITALDVVDSFMARVLSGALRRLPSRVVERSTSCRSSSGRAAYSRV